MNNTEEWVASSLTSTDAITDVLLTIFTSSDETFKHCLNGVAIKNMAYKYIGDLDTHERVLKRVRKLLEEDNNEQ